MISKLSNILFLVFVFLGTSLVTAFTTNGPFTSPLRQNLDHSAKSYVIGQAGSTRTSSTLFGKKAARAQGNESKRKKQRVKKPKDDVIEVDFEKSHDLHHPRKAQ